MIENLNDLISLIIIVSVPLIIIGLVLKPLLKGFSVDNDSVKDEEIEYYREW